jgi:hypothetical protein
MLSYRKTWTQALGLTVAFLLAAVPARAVEPDKLTPADAKVVVVVNVRQILDSAVVKKTGLDQLKAALKQNAEVQKMLTAAGLDPFTDVESIMVAGSAKPQDLKNLVVVRGKFNTAKAHAAAADFAEKNADKLKITKEGTFNLYEIKNPANSVFATFTGPNVLLLSPSKPFLLDAAKNDGLKPVKLEKEMESALKKVNGKESLWVALVITDEMRMALKNNPPTAELAAKLEAVTASLNLTDALQALVQVHTSDEEAAAKLGKLLEGFLPILNFLAKDNADAAPIVDELIKNLKITPEKTTLSISLKITEAMLNKVGPQNKK